MVFYRQVAGGIVISRILHQRMLPERQNIGTAGQIAEMATRGEDISAYFTNKFTVVRPVRRVNVDLTHGMLRELDARAARLNISRQAVIKTLLERSLNEERAGKPRGGRRPAKLPAIMPTAAQCSKLGVDRTS